MDYIYGTKRSNTNDDSSSDSKRLKTSLPPLPTSLPSVTSNSELTLNKNLSKAPPKTNIGNITQSESSPISSGLTQLKDRILDSKPSSNQSQPIFELKPSKPKEIVPIAGTNITLKTDEDIQEWIKQRKLNWMKKISNNRPKEETLISETTDQSGIKSQKTSSNNVKQQRNRNQNTRNLNDSNGQRSNNPRNNNQRSTPFIKKGISTTGPNVNLNNLIIQREMKLENLEILKFIKEIFDSGIINESKEEEKEVHKSSDVAS